MVTSFTHIRPWVTIALFVINSLLPCATQQPQTQRIAELRENDPLSYAVVYARRTNNQFALSEIAVHYAELGEFEEALRINDSASDEDWRTGAYGEIALEYWKHGEREKARALFVTVASLPLPKDVIYIWGDIIDDMAEAQQFDLALETTNGMAEAGGSTAGNALQNIVEKFVKAKTQDPTLPDILPRVISIAKTLRESSEEGGALKQVAVAYAAQGQYERATKMLRAFKEDFDRDDTAHEVAIELAKHGLYERALKLAETAGDYFREIALVEIASEVLQRGDRAKALEIVTHTNSLISKTMSDKDYEPGVVEAKRLAELAVLYSKLDRRERAIEVADLAFKIARSVGKPGERYDGLRHAVNTYCELGLYEKAVVATKALDDYNKVHFLALGEVGAHAMRKGDIDAVGRIVSVIKTTPEKESEELRVNALVVVARAGAEQGRYAEAEKLLMSMSALVKTIEPSDNTPEVLKNFAVAFAEAGNVRVALDQVRRIQKPFFITEALIDIGVLCVKKNRVFNEDELKLLSETVMTDLPPEIEPGRTINEAGWEIPGLAQARMLRPPELQKTRDRPIQLYFTYYEPEAETFIKRLFPSRHKPKPEQTNWTSRGLKISLIEEQSIGGRKFAYRLTAYEIFQDNATGLPKYTDHLETLFYFDEDGDGKFETLEEGLDYFGRGHIPKWVLEK